MLDAVKNFSGSVVVTAPSPATTGLTVTVTTGDASTKFPAVPFDAVIFPASTAPTITNAEIVTCTSVTGDTFTITRQSQSSAVRTIAAGDQFVAAISAKTITDLDFGSRLVKGNMGFFSAIGDTNTQPTPYGMALTTAGTATSRVVSFTNLYSRLKKFGLVSASTAGSLVVYRLNVPRVTLGGGTIGGFRMRMIFSCSDAATVASPIQFVGVSNTTAAPTATQLPSALLNSIGIGNGPSDTNLQLFYGGTTAQTQIDLGANFPANTLGVDAYLLDMYAPIGTAVVNITVTRLNTGNIFRYSIPAGTAGVTLPAATMGLTPLMAWRSNNATALSVGLDTSSFEYETEY
jgi:hypothetical protein